MHVHASTLLPCKFLTRENIDEVFGDSSFPYQIFLLAIADVVPATVCQYFPLSKFVYTIQYL